MSSGKSALVVFAVIFIVMQFIKNDTEIKPADKNLEIKADAQVMDILKKSCYDCHSDTPKIPFYGHIAPASWVVHKDITDARAALNFSTWQDYNSTKQFELRKSMFRAVYAAMPPAAYTFIHTDTKLDKTQVEILRNWCNISIEEASKK
ncbi:MAG: hypothetical protein RL154_1056 [Pseudomonadota bacterium]|jgi:hypothetical protein